VSLIFLFGAGASYGSGPCAPFPPPLGSKLFRKLRVAGGIAATVPDDLAAEFSRDFEAGMDRFWTEHHPQRIPLLKDMARFFAPFEPRPENFYVKLLQVLFRDAPNKAVMVTTNYDLLIERAAAILGRPVCDSFPAPAEPLPGRERSIPVLKIHGSCNYLPDIFPGPNEGFYAVGNSFTVARGGTILDAKAKHVLSTQEIIDFCDAGWDVAPALALYSPEKPVLFCRTYIRSLQRYWLDALASATAVYVIGLRVHEIDTHIWGKLAKATAPIYYVGPEGTDFLNWAGRFGRQSVGVLANTFEEAVPRIEAHLHSGTA
jgi:hypothetical protein